jgi:hypothetical protein
MHPEFAVSFGSALMVFWCPFAGIVSVSFGIDARYIAFFGLTGTG